MHASPCPKGCGATIQREGRYADCVAPGHYRSSLSLMDAAGNAVGCNRYKAGRGCMSMSSCRLSNYGSDSQHSQCGEVGAKCMLQHSTVHQSASNFCHCITLRAMSVHIV
jgi:hypothetical protein